MHIKYVYDVTFMAAVDIVEWMNIFDVGKKKSKHWNLEDVRVRREM